MVSGTQPKLRFQRASEVCGRFELGDAARPLLRDDLPPEQFLDALITKNCFQDAAKFLAQALPKQDAVWWACQCVRSTVGPNPPPKVLEALAATEKWAADPTDANRRAAMKAGEAATFQTPAGCAALAAFLSGGSLGPPEVQEIPPGDHLTGATAAGAIMLATVVSAPERAEEKLRAFVDQGLQIARSGQTSKS